MNWNVLICTHIFYVSDHNKPSNAPLSFIRLGRLVMPRMYIAIILIIFSIGDAPRISLATMENDPKQQAFLTFEKQIFDMITSSMKPIHKLDSEIDEKSLYNIVLTTKDTFAENSLSLAKIKVPPTFPDDIKASLEKVKEELIKGFRALEESMNFYAQYIANRNPNLYDKYIEKRDIGFLYIDGGLTSLTTVRLQLNAPKRSIPNSWKVGKKHFYQLEKVIPIESNSN